MKRVCFLLLAAVLLQGNGFSQNHPLLKYVPGDVNSIFHLDLKRMGSKIPGETFRQSFIYRELMKYPDRQLNDLLSAPEKLGIDMSAGILIALKDANSFRPGDNDMVMHLFIKLTDGDVFTRSIDKIISDNEWEMEKEVYKTYGTDRIISTNGKVTAGWNKDVFVLTTGYGDDVKAELEKYMYDYMHDTVTVMAIDTMAVTDTPPPPMEDTAVSTFDYEGFTERLKKSQRELVFQLLVPAKAGVLNNATLVELMNAEGDIRFWTNQGNGALTDRMLPYASVIEKLKDFSGKNSAAVINFENGKIVGQSRNYLEGAMAEIYKKYPSTVQDLTLLKRMPVGDLLGYATLNFNQQMAGELLQKSGLLELLDSMKNDIHFDLSLIPGAFKSQVAVAVVKNTVNENTDEWTRKNEGIQLVIAVPIADKNKFDKLKAAFPAFLDSLKKEKEHLFSKTPVFADSNNEFLVISLSPKTNKAFLDHPGNGPIPSGLGDLRQHPLVLSLNMGSIIDAAFSQKKEEEEMDEYSPPRRRDAMKSMLEKFDKVLIYGGAYNNGVVSSTMEFTFKDANQNSLKQLFEMLSTMIDRTKEMEEEQDDNYKVDTAVIAMPDSAMIIPDKIDVPAFKDSLVQNFANEYASYIEAYIVAAKSGDMQKFAQLGERGQVLAQKATNATVKTASDPEESKKLTDWITSTTTLMMEVSKYLTGQTLTEEELDPPPPPPAVTDVSKIAIPTFKNPEVAAFAKEYRTFAGQYIETYKKKDKKKIAVLDEKGEAMYDKSQTIMEKLSADATESKKLKDFIDKVNEQVGLVLGENKK